MNDRVYLLTEGEVREAVKRILRTFIGTKETTYQELDSSKKSLSGPKALLKRVREALMEAGFEPVRGTFYYEKNHADEVELLRIQVSQKVPVVRAGVAERVRPVLF